MTNNADNRILALYGGTFDPIHQAHINTVKAMASEAGLEQVILLPNNVPPHRPQPKADAKQRLMMVQLAVNGDPLFLVDDRELRRDALSYTVETLSQDMTGAFAFSGQQGIHPVIRGKVCRIIYRCFHTGQGECAIGIDQRQSGECL